MYITGNSGNVENCYIYDAFGNVLESWENIRNRILYTGLQYDHETGQYYLRVRYYNPVIGRFTQEDTYKGDGLNLHAYCGNNPVMYYDPSGHNSGLGQYNITDQAEPDKQKMLNPRLSEILIQMRTVRFRRVMCQMQVRVVIALFQRN